jgi:hypothetical protein
MSFSRIHYDSCTYAESLNDNASQLDYTMDPTKYVNCGPCRFEAGPIGGNEVTQAPAASIVDIESSLKGIDRPSTRCAAYKFQHPDVRRGGDGTHPDDYIQGFGMYKTSCPPKVPIYGEDLPTCSEFLDEREVPVIEPRPAFSCHNWQ